MVIHLIFKYSGAFLQLYKVVTLNKHKSNVTKNNLKIWLTYGCIYI